MGWTVPILLVGAPLGLRAQTTVTKPAAAPEAVSLIIRTDDAGMSHSVTMALQRLIESGLPTTPSWEP